MKIYNIKIDKLRHKQVLLLLLIAHVLCSQVFSRVGGAISTTKSDSRSVNIIDVNNDGWEDIFISNGLGDGQADFLYLNHGDGTFREISDDPITQPLNPSVGASFADVNNDGFIDGVISSWYGKEDLYYLNNGKGGFELMTEGGLNPASFGETASFGDYDQDGLVDLYITSSGGDGKNFLYRNIGDGKFQLQADHPLVKDTRLSRCVTWVDADGNGKIDLYITNENNAANDLYLNRGNGVFEKYFRGGLVATPLSTMTSSWGDIDNDGDLDVFVGNAGFYEELRNQLFINNQGGFDEVRGDPVTDFKGCTFGSSMVDYDNDGHLDIFITNGFCTANLRNKLYHNNGDGTFKDRSSDLALNTNVCSYGHAWGDFNNDGFLDLMIANCKNSKDDDQQINLCMINNGNDHSWLKLKLEGVESNRSAIGARVFAKAKISGKNVWQMREISAQSGYSGQNSLVVHFGMGDAAVIDSVRIEWPSGKKIWYNNIEVNQLIHVAEDATNTSTGAVEDLEINIAPNPIMVTQPMHINIKKKLEGNWKITLSSLMGKMVWQQKLIAVKTGSKLEIPLEKMNLIPGFYLLSLSSNLGIFTRKIFLENH